MAMSRKEFLEMMANKVKRADCRRAVNDIVDQCDPDRDVRISCLDGVNYVWREGSDEPLVYNDGGDGHFWMSDLELNSFSELRQFAASHILSLK